MKEKRSGQRRILMRKKSDERKSMTDYGDGRKKRDLIIWPPWRLADMHRALYSSAAASGAFVC
jgi:hypothetical protein